MLRLRGKPFGGQVALGSATVLRATNGIPLLPARLVAQLARAPRDASIESVEIIVIARDYDAASSLQLPWARVVGIVAEHAHDDAIRVGVPTVVGIDGVLEKIEDDALVLIDGERGIVLVEPDAAALAAYQAERERIAPRRRIYLDYSHQPAVTLDGREIRVLGRAGTLEEVQQALENGADMLYVPAGSPLVPSEANDEAHLEALLNLAEAAAGKPITLGWDVQNVTAANVLQAARRAEFTVEAPLAGGPEGFVDLQNYLQDTREELLSEEIDFADVRLAGGIEMGSPIPDELAGLFIGRVVISGLDASRVRLEESRLWLDDLMAAAKGLLIPVEAHIEGADSETVQTVIALGVVGVIVSAADVALTKDLIRGIDAGAVRAAILDDARGSTTEMSRGHSQESSE